MVLCDSNVWLALALSRHAHHAVARQWFEAVEDPSSVFFCRATQQTFLRLLTNAAVLSPYGDPPLTNRQAWEAYESLLADDVSFTNDLENKQCLLIFSPSSRVAEAARALDKDLVHELAHLFRIANGLERATSRVGPNIVNDSIIESGLVNPLFYPRSR